MRRHAVRRRSSRQFAGVASSACLRLLSNPTEAAGSAEKRCSSERKRFVNSELRRLPINFQKAQDPFTAENCKVKFKSVEACSNCFRDFLQCKPMRRCCL